MPYIILTEERNEFETTDGVSLFHTEKEAIDAALENDGGFDFVDVEVIVAEVTPKYRIKLGPVIYEKLTTKKKRSTK